MGRKRGRGRKQQRQQGSQDKQDGKPVVEDEEKPVVEEEKPVVEEEEAEQEQAEGGEQEVRGDEDGPREEDSEEEDEDEDEDSEDERLDLITEQTKDAGELLEVDFDFCDVKEEDFHTVRQFLLSYLDGGEFDVSGVADAVVKQVAVGTTVGVQGESVVGFATALPASKHGSQGWFKELRKFVVSKCKDKDTKDKLNAIFDDKNKRVAWVLSERLVNLPLEISHPINQALWDDVQWAKKESAEKKHFNISHWVFVVRAAPGSQQQQGRRKKKRRQDKSSDSSKKDTAEVMYSRLEDSRFHEASSLSFTFPGKRSNAAEETLRLCMVVESSRIPNVLEKLKRDAAES